MFKKVLTLVLIYFFRLKGYSRYISGLGAKKLIADIQEKEIKWPVKIWSYRRKFLAKRVVDLGLNEDTYRKYLADFDYFKLHPVNPYFEKWINDKLTMKYILMPFSEYLPEYYFHIFNSKIWTLADCPAVYYGSVDDILKLLKIKKKLACKQVRGSLGTGFLMLEQKREGLILNNQPVLPAELKKRIQSLSDYIIT